MKQTDQNERRELTGNEEQISAMAIPINHEKKETTTQPHTRLAGPAYSKLEP